MVLSGAGTPDRSSPLGLSSPKTLACLIFAPSIKPIPTTGTFSRCSHSWMLACAGIAIGLGWASSGAESTEASSNDEIRIECNRCSFLRGNFTFRLDDGSRCGLVAGLTGAC
jgi:hypothetical protein